MEPQQSQKHPLPQSHYSWLQDGNSSESSASAAKRQRLSPNPTSPFSSHSPHGNATPTNSNFSLPNVFNSSTLPTNGAVVESFNNSRQGTMGPPQRPADKATFKPDRPLDINDLSDLVVASGIDLREEENFLAASYRGDYGNASFTSQSTQSISPNNSFDLMNQNDFDNIGGNRGSFSNQKRKRTAEEEEDERHRKLAREVNERTQHHLEDPFLWGVSLRKHLEKVAGDNGIKVPIEGLFDRIPDRAQPESKDESAEVTAPSILNRDAPLEGILSLISLSANERLRGLVEDSFVAAKSRQTNSDGVVPPEWSDLAVGHNEKEALIHPVSVTNSLWEGVAKDDSLPTKSFSSPQLGLALSSMAQTDRSAEEARLKKRAERKAKKVSGSAKDAADITAGQQLLNGTGNLNEDSQTGSIPDRPPEVKMTKKERDRLAKQGGNEEQRTRETNKTMSMQLGGKQYAWMTGGASAASSSTKGSPAPLKPLGSGTTSTATKAATPQGLAAVKDRKLGDWREDGVEGQGVQLKDWIEVLEEDGREKRTLGRAYLKLGQESPSPKSATPMTTIKTATSPSA